MLYPKGELPSDMSRIFLRWVPTYPIFADTERGQQLRQHWDPGMRRLLGGGTLAEIYRNNQLYDYYHAFIKEQEARVAK
ncbi:hypothetical protein D3C81_2179160 [compost metagenome]